MDYKREIIARGHKNGAIDLNCQIVGVSGEELPMYMDCRRYLASFMDRNIIASGLYSLLTEGDVDMIAGTSLSGIGPATTIAQMCDVPVAFVHNSQIWSVKNPLLDIDVSSYDMVVSTAPFGIPFGIAAANQYANLFAYDRGAPKQHGRGLRIEGYQNDGSGKNAAFFCADNDPIFGSATAFRKENIVTHHIRVPSDAYEQVAPGSSVILIEDSYNTGKSARAEMMKFTEAGVKVSRCLSIFDYGIVPSVESLFNLDELLDISLDLQVIDKKRFDSLRAWQKNRLEQFQRIAHR